MDNIIDYLKQLDLSDVEAKVYLTLLKNGPTSVRDLAETIAIKRTTAYFYIDPLVEKGLIMKLVRGSKKLIAANEPENLKRLVETKLESAKEVQKGFPDVLKILSTLPRNNNSQDADIKYYQGRSNAKKIYEEAFQADELRTYVFFDKNINLFPDSVKVLNHVFKKNPKLKIWEMIYDYDSKLSSEPTEYNKLNPTRYFYKIIPNQLKLSSEDILIYDGKVAILNFRQGGTSIVLNSIDFYSNFKALFDFIWELI